MLTMYTIRIISSRKFGKFSEDRNINNKILNIVSNRNKKKISVNIFTNTWWKTKHPKKKHPDPQIPSSPKKKENKGINQRPFEIRNNNNDTYDQK